MKAVVISQTFNGRVEFLLDGAYFKLLTAAAALQVELWLGNVLKLLAPAAKAGFYQRVAFDRIVIVNSGSQLTEFIAAPDQGGTDAFTGNFTLTSAAPGVTYTQTKVTATVASAQLLAANALRKFLSVQLPSTAANSAFIRTDGGGAAVADATSLELLPGQTWEPNTPPIGALNVIRGGAANVDLAVIEGQ